MQELGLGNQTHAWEAGTHQGHIHDLCRDNPTYENLENWEVDCEYQSTTPTQFHHCILYASSMTTSHQCGQRIMNSITKISNKIGYWNNKIYKNKLLIPSYVLFIMHLSYISTNKGQSPVCVYQYNLESKFIEKIISHLEFIIMMTVFKLIILLYFLKII